MAFERPTFAEILRRVLDAIESEMSGVNARLRRSVERAVGIAVAGVSHLLHGHLSEIERQTMWDTARGSYMLRWASIFGITPLQPSLAQITYAFTGTPAASIAAGTEVSIDGVTFETDAIAAIGGGGSVTVAMTAAIGNEGIGGNVEVGRAGSLVTPVAGVDSAGEVVTLAVEARDLEEEDDTSDRFIEAVRNPPKGGGPGDYIRWAEECEDVAVAKAWEYPLFLGGGTVGVLFAKANDVFAAEDPEDPDDLGLSVIPSAEEVALVLAHLQTKAPTTSYMYCYAPIAQQMNPVIRVPLGTTDAVKNAIRLSLHDLLNPDNGHKPGGVVGGTEVTVLVTHIGEAISQSEGEVNHELVYPAADLTSAFGYLWVLGDVNFQDDL